MGLPSGCPFKIGKGKSGALGKITDVPGVLVGHKTLACGDINTGVTAILPHGGNLFRDKVLASCAVINGFGKTAGLVQVTEMGTIETPIVLTNTLSVGTAYSALVKYSLERNPEIGVSCGTVNPLVCECNDGRLNDIRAMRVTEKDVLDAVDACADTFSEGAVGAGRGMVCMGLKGGVGSSSRVFTSDGKEYVLGALVLSNFGKKENLTINGEKIGEKLTSPEKGDEDKGSIIMILATNAPLSERQLKRLCRRAGAGLARTGSYFGNGSGDIAIAFTTANRVPQFGEKSVIDLKMLDDSKIDPLFELCAEAVEEAIISSLWHAETVTARGKTVLSLRDALGI
ncbi:MAG: P1 family peptidase [Clostridia bacterium]|nr:P1 family peptidase [Clostridia bacterium]